jgi:hypothetical protein
MNNFLALGALVASGWVISNALPPKPVVGLDASRSTTTAAPVTNSQTIVGRDILEARRAPVPLVRTVLPSIVISTSVEASTLPSEQKAQDEQKVQDDLDRKSVKAAVEADGYKHATLIGRASNGNWRAKAYRGATEVWLTVDGTGRVSLD